MTNPIVPQINFNCFQMIVFQEMIEQDGPSVIKTYRYISAILHFVYFVLLMSFHY